MSNKYTVKLINLEGCKFDEDVFSTKAAAKKWAKGRTGSYKAIIQKNLNYMGMEGYVEATEELNINN